MFETALLLSQRHCKPRANKVGQVPTVEPLFHGLAVRHQDGCTTWLQVGHGRKCLRADAEGIMIRGKRHSWSEVEKISVHSVQRSLSRSAIEMVLALIGNQPGTQAGTFVALLLRTGAFEKTHRCGPPILSATPDDDSAATSLLTRLREERERSEFFGA
jgi:hypothetical protein